MGIQKVKQGMVKDLESKLTDIESTSGGVNGITSVDGKIGIGTLNPSAKLNVVDGGSSLVTADENAYLRVTHENGNAQIGLFRSGSSEGGGYIGANSDASFIVMDQSRAEQMRVNSSGKVGIGTTSPEHDLHVKDHAGQICVEGIGSDYAEGVFVSKNKGGTARGGGLAMKSTDSAGNNHVEWYVGRPYNGNDKLIIARQTGDSTEGRSIAQSSNAIIEVNYHGVTTQSTNWGYFQFGPQNSSFCHFNTGNGLFYFNKQCQASGGFVTYSDERLKENVTVVENAVDALKKIRGVSFTWKKGADSQERREGKMFGVLAQEVLKIDPEMCEQPEAVSDGDEKFYTFDYSNLTPYFIEAIKEQQATIESQQAKIDNLEARISALEASISS